MAVANQYVGAAIDQLTHCTGYHHVLPRFLQFMQSFIIKYLFTLTMPLKFEWYLQGTTQS